ncbi:oxalurate catabolism protein HpxZ [Tanticharoenia sakaeratensis]|uniref:DUF4440 domain-containing protein n=1 Tax=Tanticharoenia sakaeratensis NBRC 103193 TaxID=1231623 RepID=A0A0D6MLN9_9PROT|nr:oxalurate catabolism protein HpxZ [Tanticharoenia sakaeratensis]GAN54320.1 hypothetical protein Tasa_019_005 [Tanticharoenia sakaeratensis NBRC 103193]GBQ18957.1 hypothetical protein AA103193_0867 [Tanticharoenia sakaeratensis NBRC 103193]
MDTRLNEPAILQELEIASDAYERALADNDIETLDRLFHDGPEVVRYGVTECLYGAEEIAAFRRARTGGSPPRENLKRVITTIGSDVGCVNIEFQRLGGSKRGRQSQTWWRGPDGWRVISAHVSLMG